VAQELLPQCRGEVLGQESLISATLAPARKSQPDEPAGSQAQRVTFPTVFSFLELQLPTALAQATVESAHSEVLFAAGSALMTGAVIVLGLFLLFRVSGEQRLVQLRSEFVQGVSHELKTPLTLIRLYGDTLMEDADFSDEERRSCYEVIVRESERLGRLIENVLDFTRVERGHTRYEFTEGDLAPVVSQVVETYGRFLALHGFTLQAILPKSVPKVRFSAEEVTQAVLNLMDNARKYSGGSNTITVRLWYEAEKVIVEVEDHGIGIPPEEQRMIFRQFYRAHPGGETGGCGLGLFLVSNTMEAHGGAIEVRSEIGRGSRFRLVFPVCSQVSQEEKSLARQPLLTRFFRGSELYAQDPNRRGSRGSC
jgi:two-component system, OmpR family, phosphate regulon sensor histidine kinase PhoR